MSMDVLTELRDLFTFYLLVLTIFMLIYLVLFCFLWVDLETVMILINNSAVI